MQKADIEALVLQAIEMANHAREDGAQIPVKSDTPLYGSDGYLDSMGLVALLIDIEEALMEQDIQVTLSDEKAMSQTRSPFKNVRTLVEFIGSVISGK